MFNITTTNQHGQIVIPSKIRKRYGIVPNTHLKITPKKYSISLEIITDENLSNTYPKTKQEIPVFETDGKPSNLAEEIDKIVY